MLLESPIDIPEAIIADIRQGLASADINRYPVEIGPALQAQLAEWLGLPNQSTSIFGNGALDLIDSVLLSHGAGASVLSLEPDFWMYRLSAGKHGIKLHTHALEDGAMDMAAMTRQIRDVAPELIVFSNPHNPTSAFFPLHDVETILRETRGLVLVDEVFAPFAAEPNAMIPLLGRYPNLMLLRSFSKVGAPAIRFGFLLGHKKILERIRAWQMSFAVNTLSMLVAQSLIRYYGEIEAAVREVVTNREQMIRELRDLPGIVVYPSSTNFIVVRLIERSAPAICRHLVANGVRVIPLGGAALENCLRFSVDTRPNNHHAVDQLLLALSQSPTAEGIENA